MIFSATASIGDFSYTCAVEGTFKKGFSISFDDLTDVSLASFQKILGDSPITINKDGVSVQYNIAKASLSVNSENATLKLEITTGNKLKNLEGSGGLIISAPYKDGSFPTIENKKSKSLNQMVNYYQYVNSIDFFNDNLE